MALTAATTTAKTPDKSITVMQQGTASAVMYTVPTGRKFQGVMWTSENNYYGQINNISMRTPYNGAYGIPLPIVLTEGEVVKASVNSSDYCHLQGIETDA